MKSFAIACGIGLLLTLIFWSGVLGKTWVGGDLWPYYFPQKQVYAEALSEGTFAFWNPRVGFGYPALAESQTGHFYPPHLLCYSCWDVQTAYQLNQAVHYVLAFGFAVLLGLRLGLSWLSSVFAATIYTFAWAPARLCLEWAVIGAMWLPCGLWLLESWLQTNRSRYLIALPLVLGLQLLAGHYNLAFGHLLLLAVWAVGRLTFARDRLAENIQSRRVHAGLSTAAALLLGLLIAVPQLLPTWFLKQSAGQASLTEKFSPAENHIPPLYFGQLLLSHVWSADGADVDASLRSMTAGAVDAPTNKVEAHFYLGVVPLLLLPLGLLLARRDGTGTPGWIVFLLGIALASMIYATGWLVPITKHLPGFGYFRGPARFTLLSALTLAIGAGWALDQLRGRFTRSAWRGLALICLLLTFFDLRLASRRVTYVLTLDTEIPLASDALIPREQSGGLPARVYAPYPNLFGLEGVAQWPVYLGLGPDVYFDPEQAMPPDEIPQAGRLSKSNLAWLSARGVTHLLSWEPLDENAEEFASVERSSLGLRSIVHGRPPQAPLWVARMTDARGRVEFQPASDDLVTPEVRESSDRMVVRLGEHDGGELLVRDLYWPGWSASAEGKTLSITERDGYRLVDVPAGVSEIEFRYLPRGLWVGIGLSVGALLALFFWGWKRRTD